jgi:CheY-like chemotaxis protein
MGGEIGVESTPRQGSLFWFKLPMQVETMPLAQPPAKTGPVLVVDDLPVAAMATQGLLTTMLTTAVVATQGEEAVAKLREAAAEHRAFEFVLVDFSTVSGVNEDWVRKAREIPELKSVKFILMSAPNRHSDTAAPFPPEFAAMLVKPVLQPEQLIEVFREARGAVQEAAPARESVRLSRQGLRVLVAEDNNVNRVVLGGMLKKLGCVVEFAENGAEAVAKTRLSSHDIIFMDCLMPEMDGWNATLEIRRLDSRTPIVATTANATADDKSRCMKVGMNDYLSKPLRLAEMVRVMERWVG